MAHEPITYPDHIMANMGMAALLDRTWLAVTNIYTSYNITPAHIIAGMGTTERLLDACYGRASLLFGHRELLEVIGDG